MTRQEAGKDLSAVGHHLVVEVSFEMSFVKNGDHANIITTIIFSPRNKVQGTQQSAFSVRGFVGLLTASDWSK